VEGVFGDCQFTCFPDCQLALPPESAKNLFLAITLGLMVGCSSSSSAI